MNEKKTDLRILKTYKSLCEAFKDLLVHKNFEDITVNELCEKALVRRPTFYKHFADKYEFFAFFVRNISDVFSNNYNEASYNGSYYTFMFEQALDFFEENTDLVRNAQNSTVFSNLVMIFSEEIQRTIYLHIAENDEKEQFKELSLIIATNFIAGGIARLLLYYVKNRSNISRAALMESVEELFTKIIK
ncbi:MAG: TetR/AcrR family transcriptional regulator [Wujia sp.]